MANKKTYVTPLLSVEDFTLNSNIASSGNEPTPTTSPYIDPNGEPYTGTGVPMNGNAGNNQECWSDRLKKYEIIQMGNHYFVCLPGYQG